MLLSLKKLSFLDNKIITIPTTLAYLTNLNHLGLDTNKVTVLQTVCDCLVDGSRRM